MSTFIARLSRDFTCVAAAAVITLIAGMAFVQSTAVRPASQPFVAAVSSPAPRAA
jgi:hypothetical protein